MTYSLALHDPFLSEAVERSLPWESLNAEPHQILHNFKWSMESLKQSYKVLAL